MAVLRAFFTLCLLSVFAFGFLVTKRANDNLTQIQALIEDGTCLDAASRIANERDRTAAITVCLEEAGVFLGPSPLEVTGFTPR